MVDSASIGSDATLRSAVFTELPSASMYASNPGPGGPGGPGGPDTFTYTYTVLLPYTYTVLLPLGLGLDEEAPLAPAAASVPFVPGGPGGPGGPGEEAPLAPAAAPVPFVPGAPGLPSLPGGPGGPLGAAQSSAVKHTRVGVEEPQLPQHQTVSSSSTAQGP